MSGLQARKGAVPSSWPKGDDATQSDYSGTLQRPLPRQVRIRDAAMASLERGWSVVPIHSVSEGRCSCRSARCTAPGKHPRIRWEMLCERLPDRDDLCLWWRRWPRANLGVVTGRVSGLVVLDVDPRNGGDVTFAELAGIYGPPPHTVEALTGGGGRHFYFRHPGVPVACGPIAVGLDLKGERGVVVCPPSVHSSGRAYLWSEGCAPGDVPLAGMPGWLVQMSRGSSPTRGGSWNGREHPARTFSEREEFVQLWSRFGIQLVEGDRYYLCPFHPDHRPSLHIDAEGCRFYCFGCTRGGGLGRLRRLAGVSGSSGSAPPGVAGAAPPARSEPVTLRGESTVQVVGESSFQDELLDLTGGKRRYGGVRFDTTAQLVPEPDNPVDPLAVRVVVTGRVVGYLSRTDAARLRSMVTEAIQEWGAASCRATILGGWEREHGKTGLFGVRLYLPESLS